MWTIFKKLIFDLFKDRFKLFLLLLATFLSIWGISTVMYGHWFTERDFVENFGYSQTADMILYSDDFSDSLITELESWREIEVVEKRGLIGARIKDDEGEWMPLLLHIVENFENVQINRFKQEKNQAPPNRTILIEKNGALFLDDEQKTTEIQIPNLGTFNFPIHGYVHDPRLPPSRMEHMVYGYISKESIKELSPIYSFTRFLIRTTENQPTRQNLKAIGDQITSWFDKKNLPVSGLDIPEPNVHPHQNIVDALALLQRFFGGIIAIMGMILFSLVLLAWILPQLKEIGMMKALGANSREIQQAYFMLIFTLGFVGLIPGLFLGYKSGELYNRFIAFTQNFEVIEGGFPLLNNLLVVSVCLLLPLIVGLKPIRHACRQQSREIIHQVFRPLVPNFFQFVQKILPTPHLKYVANNLFRQGSRFLLSVCLLTTGMTLLFIGIHLTHSLKKDTAQYFEKSAFQFSVYFPQNQTSTSINPDKIGADAWYPIHKRSLFPLSNQLHQTLSLRYLPLNFEFPDAHILQGAASKGCQSCLWINQGLLPEFQDIKLGDSLRFQDSGGKEYLYEYKGVIKELGVGGTMYTYGSDSINDRFSEIWLAFDQNDEVLYANRQQELESFFERNAIPISGIASSELRLQMLRDHLKPTFITITAMGIFAIICGLIGLAIMLNIQLTERKGEIGLLSAIGSSERQIAGMWLNEILILNIISIFLTFFLSLYGAVRLCELFGDTILHIPILFFPDWVFVFVLIIVILGGQILLGGPYLLKLLRKNAYQRLNQGVD